MDKAHYIAPWTGNIKAPIIHRAFASFTLWPGAPWFIRKPAKPRKPPPSPASPAKPRQAPQAPLVSWQLKPAAPRSSDRALISSRH